MEKKIYEKKRQWEVNNVLPTVLFKRYKIMPVYAICFLALDLQSRNQGQSIQDTKYTVYPTPP